MAAFRVAGVRKAFGPDSGSIRVGDHDLASHRDLNHYRARDVGMVFQLHNLLPTLTASENAYWVA